MVRLAQNFVWPSVYPSELSSIAQTTAVQNLSTWLDLVDLVPTLTDSPTLVWVTWSWHLWRRVNLNWEKKVGSYFTLMIHIIHSPLSSKFSYACRRYPSTQIMASERWRLSLFRGMSSHYISTCTLISFSQGQCWRNREPQGRNERFRHHWSRSKRMCASIYLFTHLLPLHFWPIFRRIGGSMASYCIKCWYCRVILFLYITNLLLSDKSCRFDLPNENTMCYICPLRSQKKKTNASLFWHEKTSFVQAQIEMCQTSTSLKDKRVTSQPGCR